MPAANASDGALVEACGGSQLLAALLAKRGITDIAEVKSFLDPSIYVPTAAAALPDMPSAVARVRKAIEKEEHITVYGDYDVDGVTATAVMMDTLKSLGAKVDFHIPTRSEGYGLNLKAVSVLASKHRTKLIITCDCGISNFSEINFARSLGVDTIIVDHHTMPDLMPPAAAILHPKLLDEQHPLYHLPGVGVAYKFAEGLLRDFGQEDRVLELQDFVTLGMIADMVPLVKENRYLVQTGMPRLMNSKRPGIQALLAQVGGREGTDVVGFGIAPRINAVGRLSDANSAVKLMLTTDTAEAAEIARQLETENLRRQELCEKIFFEADRKAAHQLEKAADRALAIYDQDWHHGVVGIVASRLVEKYHCPVFIGELDAAAGIVKGSARGVNGIDLYEVLKANEHLAIKWGGHKMAAGFSVEAGKAEIFCRSIVDTCNRILGERPAVPQLDIDLKVKGDDLNLELAKEISRLAPFGIGNRKPMFMTAALLCASTRPLGKEGKHNRVMLNSDNQQLEAVFWNSGMEIPQPGQIVDVAFTPEVNNFNGRERLQLVLADWRDNAQPDAMLAPRVAKVQEVPQEVMSFAPPAPQPATAGDPDGTVAFAPPPLDALVPVPVSDFDSTSVLPPLAPGSVPSALPPAPPAVDTQHGRADDVTDFSPPPVVRQVNFPRQSQLAAGEPAGGRGPEDTGKAVSPQSIEKKLVSRIIQWKDLRGHESPQGLVDAACRKLGANIALFAEGAQLAGYKLADRTEVADKKHLLIWQLPPSKEVFRALVEKSGATTVYLIGAASPAGENASQFLKRLLGVVRFAVNQRDGQASADKLTAALGTTKMSLALGLMILKKVDLIDWFSEDGTIFLDMLGPASSNPEQLPEFRQLGNCLAEIAQFRSWCMEADLKEIQLALVPNALPAQGGRNQELDEGSASDPAEQQLTGADQYDGENQLSSHQSG
jgi:single-stranded-DNA-specific exonuclease